VPACLVALVLAQAGAPTAPQAKAAAAAPAAASEAVVETSEGAFTIRLLPQLAPAHVKHFVATARKGGFDGTTFHRIIAGGIIQGGDPLSKDPKLQARYGTGGLGLLKSEFSERPMTRASVAAVLRPRDPDSAGNQFFVCLSDQPALTGKYTIFGEVVAGMDVVDRIGQTPVEGDRAAKRVEIRKVTLGPAASPTPAPPNP
jgi:peptidyl-prolyl cis-trans isomerase B (cyclophilin B)